MILASTSDTYAQDIDCCASGLVNELVVQTHDGGGGWYLTIATDRWALNPEDIDGFAAMLKATLAREPKNSK